MLIREYEKRIFCFLLIFVFMLSFSFYSLSDAYTGAYLDYEEDPVTGIVSPVLKDVNPAGQTFSGSNVIEMNVYNNAPDLERNTFNGSTEINNTFQNLDSTGNKYNGSVDIDLNGTGTMTSTVDTFQNASVNASMSDVNFDNPTFNGNTTLQANNLTLGSVPQMDALLDQLYIFFYSVTNNLSQPSPGSYSVTNPSTGNTVTVPYDWINVYTATYSNGNITFSQSYSYGTFAAKLNSYFDFVFTWFRAISQYLIHQNTYKIYSFITNGEHYNFTYTESTSNFIDVLINRLDMMMLLIQWYCNAFFNWYYPLDNVLPEYWRYYNTDTAQSEEIGLAGLMYNISWYLGQMYVLQSGSDALDNFTDQVETVSQTFQEAEQREEQIMDSISSGIESFNPDLSEIGAFKALGWCSNYLQLVFLRLGAYGTVILVGLLLGVCMQFIGYFRYK